MTKDMTKEERDLLVEELKQCNDDYRYRDQLIVTEFGISMTAFAVGLNGAINLTGWIQILVFAGISIFVLIIANHIGRVNQDRLKAGDRMNAIKEQLKLLQIHQGYAGKRGGIIKIPAPKTMVWYLWLATTSSLVVTAVLVFRQFGA